MKYIKGFTFPLRTNQYGIFEMNETKRSLECLKKSSNIETVVFVIGALQDTPQTEKIQYKIKEMPSDKELIEILRFAKGLGLRIILKPMLNCRNGVWRANIAFFDKEVPCEPKWSKWFESYMEYMVTYAKLAEEVGCEMLIIGCELVMTERKEKEWRKVIGKVREVYYGLITYNTDKYQEEMITWWDAVDVISSSGYYPIDAWEENLGRIEKVVNKYKKPFFFAECGCMSMEGSEYIPNDWTFRGEVNEKAQADYFTKMFEECRKRKFVQGFVVWDWTPDKKKREENVGGYDVDGKLAERIIYENYKHAEFY